MWAVGAFSWANDALGDRKSLGTCRGRLKQVPALPEEALRLYAVGQLPPWCTGHIRAFFAYGAPGVVRRAPGTAPKVQFCNTSYFIDRPLSQYPSESKFHI